MEMYADHKRTFWNYLNIYETYINTRIIIWFIQATTGSCNYSLEVELLLYIFEDDAHLSSDQFKRKKKNVSKSYF